MTRSSTPATSATRTSPFLSRRKTAVGIAHLVMLSELAVNQALDHVELKS
ncbi:hypothetical protein PDR5_25550 [Pseudomonas sp. DR 5-09]|nr:hypothetical protein PDR5_25550 [Pseudomonas sp. DR 5-09]